MKEIHLDPSPTGLSSKMLTYAVMDSMNDYGDGTKERALRLYRTARGNKTQVLS